MNHPESFPIDGRTITSIPWAMIVLHDSQCLKNHGHNLAQMAATGGLTPSEAIDVLDDRRWSGQLIRPWARTTRSAATPSAAAYEAEHEAELANRVQQWEGGR